jgi:hypothetical protein
MALFYLLKAFANGGSSLTGLEAISNGVSVFQNPQGLNARKTLLTMSIILGTIVAGVSWLAHATNAQPFVQGTPTVISQVASAVLGEAWYGHAMFFVVQLATMLILYTGANTPFNGFPFLASFVAEDQFLPQQLTRRGHRLAFSNGIIVLTIVSVALLIGTDAQVNNLVAFYAIGVFTGFTLAGFGMAKYFRTHPDGPQRGKIWLNTASGTVSAIVVVVFAVVKFTEGAWLVLILFPLGVFGLFRLNRQYRLEAAALKVAAPEVGAAKISRHSVVVLVDNADLATIAAVRYASSLGSSSLRAVHFILDETRADELMSSWAGQAALSRVPLDLIHCRDRRLTRAVRELAVLETTDPTTELTLLLPRRTYARFLGRILHDHTADDIARAISQQPRVVATVVPFDVNGLLERRTRNQAALRQNADAPRQLTPVVAHQEPASVSTWDREDAKALVHNSAEPADVTRVADLAWRERATVSGQVRAVRLAAVAQSPSLEVELWDESGGVVLVFYGRRHIAGIRAGARLTAVGTISDRHGKLAMANPVYRLEPSE